MSEMEFPDKFGAGKKPFLRKAMTILNPQAPVAAHEPAPKSLSLVPSDSAGQSVQQALLDLIGKPNRELVHVDLQEKLVEKGLAGIYPLQLWPQTTAVRELATKLRKREKAGEANPFIAVELKK